MKFRLQPQCGEKDGLVLSYEPVGNALVLAKIDQAAPDKTLWYLIPFADNAGGYRGICLQNVEAGKDARGPSEKGQVYLGDLLIGDNKFYWNPLPGGFSAVQMLADTKLNLNVEGNGPYREGSAVLAWPWGGGKPNELWKIVQVDGA